MKQIHIRFIWGGSVAIFVIALLLFARAAGIDTAILKGQSPEKDSKQQEAEAQKAAIRAEGDTQRTAIRKEAEIQKLAQTSAKQQEAEAQKAAIRAEAEKQRAAIRAEAEAQRAAVSTEAGTQAGPSTSALAVAAPTTAPAGAETMLGTLATVAGASGVGLRILFRRRIFLALEPPLQQAVLGQSRKTFFQAHSRVLAANPRTRIFLAPP